MGNQFDIEHIREVLREATGDDGPFSQRGLSKAAGEGRDCVGDIINGRNTNPTGKVLANLARAMGGDLSIFGLSDPHPMPQIGQILIPTRQALERAFADALPELPRATDRRVEYLAQVVLDLLQLPPDHREADRSVG